MVNKREMHGINLVNHNFFFFLIYKLINLHALENISAHIIQLTLRLVCIKYFLTDFL